ncbi:MAG: tetratricopeptide repeat protein [SAR324 cluster bacterium]|nr:tetratricopeptide repeat protein [SAR324 cluster bacterium]
MLTSWISSHRNFFVFAALAILVSVVYHPAIEGTLLWDDWQYTVGNPLLGSWEGLWKIWTASYLGKLPYFPLTFSTFWLEHYLWGGDLWIDHIINIVLHIGNAFLVIKVLQRLQFSGAVWVAALFALHPVHVESVAWVSERSNVLSTFFYLLTLYYYIGFQQNVRWKFYWAALACFPLALFAKTATCMLPVVLILLTHYIKKRISIKLLLPLGPFFVFALVVGLLTIHTESQMGISEVVSLKFNGLQRFLLANHIFLFYLSKLFLPYPLMAAYPLWDLKVDKWSTFWPILVNSGLIISLSILWWNNYRKAAYAFLYFGISLFPVLGFFNTSIFTKTYVADHFQYLPSLGIFALVVQTGMWGIKKKYWNKTACAWTGVMICLVLGFLSWNRSLVFRSGELLWQDAIAKDATLFTPYHMLGNIYLQHRKYQQAIEELNQAIANKKDYADAYLDRAVAHSLLQHHKEAIADFTQFIQWNKNNYKAYSNRGVIYLNTKRYAAAIADFTKVIELAPNPAKSYHGRGMAYFQLGNHQQAVEDYTRAIALYPSPQWQIYYNRGRSYWHLKQYQHTLADFNRANQLNPQFGKIIESRGLLYIKELHDPIKGCLDLKLACQSGYCQSYQMLQADKYCK